MEMSEAQRALARVLILRGEIQKHAARYPSGIVLPQSLRPEGEPETGAFCMGLPVRWGDRLALIYDA